MKEKEFPNDLHWVSKYKAQIDYYAKTITFQTPKGRRMVFEGERIPKLIALILVVTAQKLLRNGCVAPSRRSSIDFGLCCFCE